jgi:hypothetical protein
MTDITGLTRFTDGSIAGRQAALRFVHGLPIKALYPSQCGRACQAGVRGLAGAEQAPIVAATGGAHAPVPGQAASSRTECTVCPVWRSWMPRVICEIRRSG